MKRREFIAALLRRCSFRQGVRGRRGTPRLGFLAVGDGSGQALNQAERDSLMSCDTTAG